MSRQQEREDLCIWADGTFCRLDEVETMTFMSDDYEVIPFDSFRAAHVTGALEDGCNALFGHEYWQVLNDENVIALKNLLGINCNTV